MTNLKQLEAKKNFRLLINTIVKAHEVGIEVIEFKIRKSEDEFLMIELQKNAICLNDDTMSYIPIFEGDLNERVDDVINRIEENVQFYNDLLSSERLNISYEEFSKNLAVYIISKRALCVSSRRILMNITSLSTTVEKLTETREKYTKVVDFINEYVGKYHDTTVKIQTSSLYGKNGEVNTTKSRE